MIAVLLCAATGYSQSFTIDTLQYRGPMDKYINIVIVGDGYTAAQQLRFKSNATDFSNYFFAQVPFANYRNYFNVFAIEVISVDSGVTHHHTASDCPSAPASAVVPVVTANTYLGCSFDHGGIHRTVSPTKLSNLSSVLSAIPQYDLVVILVNSPYYGGSGSSLYATGTMNTASRDICMHEIGHTFSDLQDEYWSGFGNEAPNMTETHDPATVKWKNWLGYNAIGIYQHCCGGGSSQWYRPHNNCKMQYLSYPYCNVCSEAGIEKIHSLVNPIDHYTPEASTVSSTSRYLDFILSKLVRPIPNTLNITWTLDGTALPGHSDSLKVDQSSLSMGMHTLTAKVVDTTPLIRINNHASIHFSSVTWTINKTTTGIQLAGDDNMGSFYMFPNPANDVLQVTISSRKHQDARIRIYSAAGKLVKQVDGIRFANDNYSGTIAIGNLPAGIYSVLLQLDGTAYTQVLVKR